VNTGWTGGGFGVGNRVSIQVTRAIIRAILDRKLETLPMRQDPIFSFDVPKECPDVPSEILDPRGMWKNTDEYDEAAKNLAEQYRKNFEAFQNDVTPQVREAGPKSQ
jgi:phosphoenolpyruvate carboxykinase (ATP)